MTLREYGRIFRRRWLVLLLAIIAGAAGSGAYCVLRPAEYVASLQMYVAAQTAQDPQAAFQGAQLSAERVKSYTKLGTSQRVADEVVRRLRLPMTGQDLASHILTSSDADEVVIDMYVTDSSPQRAADVANTAATVLSEVVDDLERPQAPGAVAPVALRTVQPATVPIRPSSTGPTKVVALGLLIGLTVGVGIVLLHHAMDTSVTSPEQLEDLTGLAVLGSISSDRHARPRRSGTGAGGEAPSAEALRQLRTNLQSATGPVSHVLLLAGPTYKVDKSTTLVGLATSIASTGKKVLVIDADLHNPRVADLLRVDNSVGLSDVLTGRATAEQATVHWGDSTVDVLPSGTTAQSPSELLVAPQMRSLLATARTRYDVVIVDTPPLLSFTDAAALSSAADGVVVVCRHGKTNSQEVVGAMTALRAARARVLGTVLTNMPPSRALPLLDRDEFSSVAPTSTPVRPTTEGPNGLQVRHDPAPGYPPKHGHAQMTNGEQWKPSPRQGARN